VDHERPQLGSTRTVPARGGADDRRASRNLWLEITALALFLPAVLLLTGSVLALANVYVVKTMAVEPGAGGVGLLMSSFTIVCIVLVPLLPALALVLAVLAVRFMLVQDE
jgi:hypothetical protein